MSPKNGYHCGIFCSLMIIVCVLPTIAQKVGDIRLVGGNSPSEGRVEVYLPDQWGTICDDNWDTREATVACRQLGYSSVVSAHTKFGEGSGQPIYLDDVQCSGDEAQLSDCPHSGLNTSDCSHSEDVGVICSNTNETDIAVTGNGEEYRLLGGSFTGEGVLQFRSTVNETWNTLCTRFPEKVLPDVGAGICRRFGYGAFCRADQVAWVPVNSSLIEVLANYPLKNDDAFCHADEEGLCNLPTPNSLPAFTPQNAIWMTCHKSRGFRFVRGVVETGGSLQTRCGETERWRNVCGDWWTPSTHAHRVVCRHLGFQADATTPYALATSYSPFWGGLLDSPLTNIVCSRNETVLMDCRFATESCYYSAGLNCGNAIHEKLELKLVDSQYPASGIVVGRVSPNDDWGTICGTQNHDKRDADVVCRHLGFNESIPVDRGVFNRTQIPTSTLISQIGCSGREEKLSECPLISDVDEVCRAGLLYVECLAETERFEVNPPLCGQIHYCGFDCNQGPRATLRQTERETCKCDDACEFFNDCCYDYHTNCHNTSPKAAELSINNISSKYYSCVRLPDQASARQDEHFGFALVSSCPEQWTNWTAISVKQNCETPSPDDVITTIPVNDRNGTAYKNVFCAICHGAQPDDLERWKVSLEYKESGKFMVDPRTNITILGTPTGRYFYEPPNTDTRSIRKARTCPVRTISSCRPEFTTTSLVAACQDYFAPIRLNGTHYRNAHCAICNGEEVNLFDNCGSLYTKYNVTCSSVNIWSSCSKEPNMDLTNPTVEVVFDFGWRDREKVTCSPDQLYDPFLKRCRTVLCTSGVADDNSECVPDRIFHVPVSSQHLVKLDNDCNGILNSSLGSDVVYWQAVPASQEPPESFIIDIITMTLEKGEISSHDLLKALEHSATDSNGCNVRSVNLYIIEGTRLLSEIESCDNTTINATQILQADATNNSKLDFTASLLFIWDRQNSSFRRNVVVPQECLDVLTLHCAELVILFPEEFVYQHRKTGQSISHTLTGAEFGPREFVILQDGSAAICGPVDWSDPNQVALGIISDVCGSLSLVALTATFITYCMFSKLRNMAGLHTMNLVVALFVAILILLLVGRIGVEGYFCVALASVQHLSWLSVFFWMTTLSFSAAKRFGEKVVPVSRSGTNTRQLLLSMALVWGGALLIVSTCLVLSFCHCTNLPAIYNDSPPCVMSGGNVLLVVFGVPVAASLVFNTLCFGFVIHIVRKTKRDSKMVQNNGRIEQVMDEVKIYAKLTLLFGLTWILAFVSEAANSPVLSYINVITNTLQGVFIFIAFCLNDRVRALWRKKLPCMACMNTEKTKWQSNTSSADQRSNGVAHTRSTGQGNEVTANETKM